MTKDKYLWIVNKQNPFDKKDLEKFEILPARDTDGKSYIEKSTKEAFDNLRKYMVKTHGIALFLTSAGRTVETQQNIFEDFGKRMSQEELLNTVALPGTSEHHTGLAIDIKPELAHSPIIQKFVDTLPIPERIAYLKQPDRETKKQMYETLHSELEQFGFIVRYTEEKREVTGVRPEPWHLRYVGVENAKAINASGLCLEEFVAQTQDDGQCKNASEEKPAQTAETSTKTTQTQNTESVNTSQTEASTAITEDKGLEQ